MSASRRNRGALHVDSDKLDDGFYRAYSFKRGRGHNGKGGARIRRRILRAKGNASWRRDAFLASRTRDWLDGS